ncbi:MAG: hypothetical protein ACRDY2_01740 [Acidimicrobiales bacterium]
MPVRPPPPATGAVEAPPGRGLPAPGGAGRDDWGGGLRRPPCPGGGGMGLPVRERGRPPGGGGMGLPVRER